MSSIAVFDTQKLVAVYRGGQLRSLSPPVGRQVPVPVADWPESQNMDLTLNVHLPSSPDGVTSPLTPGSFRTGAGAGAGAGAMGRSACTATPSTSAPVSGIAFSDDRLTGSLLITTDKHIISLPLDPFQQPTLGHKKNKQSTAWDKRSIVRIDFGIPVDMNRDPESGLLFMTLKAPGGKGDLQGDTPSPKKVPGVSVNEGNRGISADCVAVVSATHTAAHPSKLSMSAAQLYREHVGAISGVISCTLCDRVVSFDDQGCLLVWRSSKDRVRNLKSTSTIASSTTPARGMRSISSSNILSSPSQALYSSASNRNKDVMTDDIDEATRCENILTKKKHKRPGEKKEKYSNIYERRARGLVKDFEMAARADPSAWCSSPIWSPPSTRTVTVERDLKGLSDVWAGACVRTSISATFTSTRVDGQKDTLSKAGEGDGEGDWGGLGATSPGSDYESDEDRVDRRRVVRTEDRDRENIMASLYSPSRYLKKIELDAEQDEPDNHEERIAEDDDTESSEVGR